MPLLKMFAKGAKMFADVRHKYRECSLACSCEQGEHSPLGLFAMFAMLFAIGLCRSAL